MAEGLLRHQGQAAVEVASAGTAPTRIHPDAIRSMGEIGIDISAQRSKPLEPFLERPFDYLVTLCDDAKESCPAFPGASRNLHWSIPDPAAAPDAGEQRMAVFRKVREDLTARIRLLLEDISQKAE